MSRLAALLLALVVAAGCSGAATATLGATMAPTANLTIFAAASLSGVLARIRPAYEAVHPGITLTSSTDSSAALRTQIEQGAPADVFLSADTTNPQQLADAGLVAGDPLTFAGNALAIVTLVDDPATVTTPSDLARPGLRIIAAGEEVPITKYATEAIARFAALPDAPAGFVEAYAANIVSREDNVKAIVAKIELGEGDAGIVYVTDAMASTRVRAVAIPAQANVVAACAGVVVGASAQPAAARAFLEWLAGPDGARFLAEFGFSPPA